MRAILLTIILLTSACAGGDLTGLVTRSSQHMACLGACAACIAALQGDGAGDAIPADHAACAAHCAGCASAVAEDVAIAAGGADPAPLENPEPFCSE